MSRRVLVTGGASGLGAALVRAFTARGDRVLVTDLTPDPEAAPGAEHLRLDITSEDDWAAALAWVEREWGGLDVLVNNAGIAAAGRIDVATIEEWRRVLDVDLLGAVRGCRTFAPLFKQQRSGHIVNVASLAGLVHPPGMASYCAAKAGVVALSESLDYELGPWGVRTSAVCPSFFRTNLADSLGGSDTDLDAVAVRLIDRSALDADAIAAAVLAGIEKQRRVILTDAPARKAVHSKRFARRLYDRAQRRMAGRLARLESPPGPAAPTTPTRETGNKA